jgi:hypothetical protein
MAAAVGLQNLSEHPQPYWEDLRYFVHILLGYFAVTTFFRRPADLRVLVRVLWGAFIVMIVAGFIFEVVGFGEPVPGMVRPFFDSSRMLLGVLLVIHVAILLNVSGIRSRDTLLHALIIVMVAVVIMLQFTRAHVVARGS